MTKQNETRTTTTKYVYSHWELWSFKKELHWAIETKAIFLQNRVCFTNIRRWVKIRWWYRCTTTSVGPLLLRHTQDLFFRCIRECVCLYTCNNKYTLLYKLCIASVLTERHHLKYAHAPDNDAPQRLYSHLNVVYRVHKK